MDRVRALTGIDRFFLDKIQNIVQLERKIRRQGPAALTPDLLRRAKEMGFADAYLAQITGQDEAKIRALREDCGIKPVYKMVDTCAAEFEAVTPYYYSCYDHEDEAHNTAVRKVVVLGSGPIRIGQGIEFDYCSVHSVWALREEGVKAIIINNNPETVSTDFDTADRLYFEPLVLEDVLNILRKERPEGVIVQFGGQTAINLAVPLARAGIPILGTAVEDNRPGGRPGAFRSTARGTGYSKTAGKDGFFRGRSSEHRPGNWVSRAGQALLCTRWSGHGDCL